MAAEERFANSCGATIQLINASLAFGLGSTPVAD